MKTEAYKNKIKELTEKEYEVLGEYINSYTYALMKHNSDLCNNSEWEVKPKKFVNDGTRCPVCSKLNRTKGQSKIKDAVFQEKIIKMYNDKNSIKEIAKVNKVSIVSVTNILKNNNITIDGTKVYEKYTDSFITDIAKEYIPGENMKDIAIKYNIPMASLMYRFKKLGIETSKRKYSVNENYFDKIDSQNKAYILGFIMADGCVSQTDYTQTDINRLIISISSKDRKVLEFIRIELGSDSPIIDYIPEGSYSDKEMSRLVVNSSTLCKKLKSYGIIARKTGHESMPSLSKEMQRHFIRGYIDGDGWVTLGGYIGICSTKKMLEEILSIFKSNYSIKSVATIYKDPRGIDLYYMQLNCANDIVNLKDYLYKDANFYMERKYSRLT